MWTVKWEGLDFHADYYIEALRMAQFLILNGGVAEIWVGHTRWESVG